MYVKLYKKKFIVLLRIVCFQLVVFFVVEIDIICDFLSCACHVYCETSRNTVILLVNFLNIRTFCTEEVGHS